jgi:hypothetical protein
MSTDIKPKAVVEDCSLAASGKVTPDIDRTEIVGGRIKTSQRWSN